MKLVIEPGRAARNYWRDLWRYRELMYFLAWCDLVVRYKQTAVGVASALTKDNIAHLIDNPHFELMRHDFTGPVNLGNPQEFTILELARKVIELTSSRSEVAFKPLPSEDPTQRQPDISLAKNRLGWGLDVALEAGLRRTIDYFCGERG